ncbi:MAG: hypothetical protein IT209_04130 [Armatimonadetes bacterium]|nr:hypothetical protein [Armatimonadota bacterium]
MKPSPRSSALAGAVLWVILALPPVRHVLESELTPQVLVQIPLLALAGALLARLFSRRLDTVMRLWNDGGIPGLLLASVAGMTWMLPRLMDASINEEGYALAKFLTVPLLVGVPVALSWPKSGFVTRGVLLLEVVATAFRMGWLYLVSPERLCSNYLLGDQQRLGKLLVAIGVVIALVLAWQLIWGRVRVESPQ